MVGTAQIQPISYSKAILAQHLSVFLPIPLLFPPEDFGRESTEQYEHFFFFFFIHMHQYIPVSFVHIRIKTVALHTPLFGSEAGEEQKKMKQNSTNKANKQTPSELILEQDPDTDCSAGWRPPSNNNW